MSRVLVAGGAGFIGSNFVSHVLEQGWDVTVLDKLTYAGDEANLQHIRDRISFHQGCITDRELVRDLYTDVDAVVNLAAESHVDRSIESGIPFVTSNVEGSFVLMDELRHADVDRFLQMSTDEIYGSLQEGTFSERDPLDPSSPYAASKASADLFAKASVETYGLPITIARCTNVFGPRQHPEKLIPKMTLNALAGEELPVYGDGTNRREWLYVSDVCRALWRLLQQGGQETYNVDSGAEKRNIDVVETILDILDQPRELIIFVEDRPGHDYRYSLSDAKLVEQFGWTPEIEFDEGLKRTVDWYRESAIES